MNVSCTSCSAKYAVPDEKVRGKKVKITCKHCGTGIIVDGTKVDAPAVAAPAVAAPAAPAPAPPAAASVTSAPAAPAPAAAAAPAASELSFDIAYPDDRQETLPLSAIVDKYAAGALNDEAFIWREGMSDWKAPFDIPEIASALSARGLKKKTPAAAAPAPAPAPAPAAPAVSTDDEATTIQASPFEGLDLGAPGGWREPAKEMPSSPEAAFTLTERQALPFEAPAAPAPTASPMPASASPAPAIASASKPAAARRASSARGGGDLFGDLAAAGSEDDESLGSDAKEAAPKMTGARNESSVLFSLDALVKQEQKPVAAKSKAKQDDAAAILMGTDSGPSSLANVGTGSFGSAFAAPDFTAPVLAPPPESRGSDSVALSSASPEKKKGAGLLIALGAILLLGGGAAVALDLPAKLSGTPAAPSAAPGATPEPAPAAPANTSPAAATASATDVVAAEPTPAPAPAAGGASAATSTGTGGAPAAATTPPPTKPTEADKPADKPVEKPADKPADKPAEASNAPPFDKAAAVAALTAAAGNAQSCKTPDGPTGSGKVSITFMPSGRATNTQVSGDLAGTAVGGCVARLFRAAKVPPFSGDAVTVSKSFSVQ